MEKDVYTIEELTDILQVTRRTIYSYIKSGKLPAIRMGKYWRVRRDQLDAFLSAGTELRRSDVTAWTDLDRQILTAMSQLRAEDLDFIIKLQTMMKRGGAAVSELIQEEAPKYRLSTPEGKKGLLKAIRAAQTI